MYFALCYVFSFLDQKGERLGAGFWVIFLVVVTDYPECRSSVKERIKKDSVYLETEHICMPMNSFEE